MFSFWKKPHVIVSSIFVIVLFVGYIYTQNALYEGICLFLVICCNCGLHEREARLDRVEMERRLGDILDTIEKRGIDHDDIKFSTNISTVQITKVIRDDNLVLLPCNLLVSGDIVVLGYGDKAPCKVSYLFSEQKLERDELLKPNFFASGISEPSVAGDHLEGMFHFKVLETPVETIIKSGLQSKRPPTVVSQHLAIIEDMFAKKTSWIVLLISLAINVFRLFVFNVDMNNIDV